jgi:hypothetical protein
MTAKVERTDAEIRATLVELLTAQHYRLYQMIARDRAAVADPARASLVKRPSFINQRFGRRKGWGRIASGRVVDAISHDRKPNE